MTEKDNDEFDKLVDKAIEAFEKLLNNNMALDLIEVQGSMRTMIIKDPRYVKKTKAIKARHYLDEINQVQDIYDASTRMGVSSDSYIGDDGREGGGNEEKKLLQAQKDSLAMQLKAAEMRRNLLALTAENAEDNEDSAINFFFCPITREEMERMKRVEIFDGSDDDKDVLDKIMDDDDKKAPQNETGRVSRGTKRRTQNKPDISSELMPGDDEMIILED